MVVKYGKGRVMKTSVHMAQKFIQYTCQGFQGCLFPFDGSKVYINKQAGL